MNYAILGSQIFELDPNIEQQIRLSSKDVTADFEFTIKPRPKILFTGYLIRDTRAREQNGKPGALLLAGTRVSVYEFVQGRIGSVVHGYYEDRVIYSPIGAVPKLNIWRQNVVVDPKQEVLEIFKLSHPVPEFSSSPLNQPFGSRPEYYAQFGLAGHEGHDYRSRHSVIAACAPGLVYRVEPTSVGNYGKQVRIMHWFRNKNNIPTVFKTIYAHLDHPTVVLGQWVERNQQIGISDSTGNSTGDHLHLTVEEQGAKTSGYYDGIINPALYA